jgi:hypothetical protein
VTVSIVASNAVAETRAQMVPALRQRWSALNEQHFKNFMKTKSTLGPLAF